MKKSKFKILSTAIVAVALTNLGAAAFYNIFAAIASNTASVLALQVMYVGAAVLSSAYLLSTAISAFVEA